MVPVTLPTGIVGNVPFVVSVPPDSASPFPVVTPVPSAAINPEPLADALVRLWLASSITILEAVIFVTLRLLLTFSAFTKLLPPPFTVRFVVVIPDVFVSW